jgi:hypothetical protein
MNARARVHAMFPLTELAECELDARLDALVKEAFAAGRASAGADGFKLDDFRAVWTRSDGSDKPVSELRCTCGSLLQRVGPASLLDLLITATLHTCPPSGGTA